MATAQLMLYFMAVNMVTIVYQFYTIIIFYYNVRSAAHKMQTSKLEMS